MAGRTHKLTLAELEAWRTDEAAIWNRVCQSFPTAADWQAWCSEIFLEVMQRPAGLKVRLEISSLTSSLEKSVQEFQQPEVWIGIDPVGKLQMSEARLDHYRGHLFLEQGSFHLRGRRIRIPVTLNQVELKDDVIQPLQPGDRIGIFPWEMIFSTEPLWVAEQDVVLSIESTEVTRWADFAGGVTTGIDRLVLRVHPHGGIICVELPTLFRQKLVETMLAPCQVRAPQSPPLASDLELLEFMLLALLEQVTRHFEHRVWFELTGENVELAGERGAAVTAMLRCSSFGGPVRVFAPLATLDWLWPDHHQTAAAASSPPPEFDLTARCLMSGGWQTLNVAEILSLHHGDVVFLEPQPTLLAGPDFNHGWQLRAEAGKPGRYAISGGFQPPLLETCGEEIMTEENNSGPDPAALPVRLHAIVAEKEFLYAELSRMAPGSILELDQPLDGVVKLALNGRLMGEGELVSLDGRLGVRILRWLS